jgi:hypothetical protein
MQWVHYWRNIVQRYLVICEGWPDDIPFENLSKVSSGVTRLETLLRQWKSGDIYWRQLEAQEFQQLLDERNKKLDSGEVVERSRRTRSDKGKKRRRAPSCSQVSSRPRKKAYKSPATIDSESEPEPEVDSDTTPHNTTPQPTHHTTAPPCPTHHTTPPTRKSEHEPEVDSDTTPRNTTPQPPTHHTSPPTHHTTPHDGIGPHAAPRPATPGSTANVASGSSAQLPSPWTSTTTVTNGLFPSSSSTSFDPSSQFLPSSSFGFDAALGPFPSSSSASFDPLSQFLLSSSFDFDAALSANLDNIAPVSFNFNF